jgi:predicted RNase H-like nuclease (RuvC/YqgF family)
MVATFLYYKHIKEGLVVGNVDKCNSCSILEVRVDKIEEEIREMKDEAKSDRKILINAISELKEYSIKMSMFMEQTNKKMDETDRKIDKLSTKIDEINTHTDDNAEVKWYQEMLSQGGKYLIYLLFLIIAIAFGVKIEEVFGILK